MKLAIIGYGKMGKAVESIAKMRGHQIVAIVDNEGILANQTNLAKADAAIEFTTPDTAFDNFLTCFDIGVPVVSGTTGWLARFDELEKLCNSMKAGFLYASNFSIGVNLFFEINKKLAELIGPYSEYKLSMEEIHHTQKKDAPSGTAITLANDIISVHEQKSAWVCNSDAQSNEIPIKAKRVENVTGTHTIKYESTVDCISISHEAKNRTGFALGAVLAAEFMKGKQGVYSMKDLLKH